MERFVSIAVRHGLASPVDPSWNEGAVKVALRHLNDERDTALLRGTDLPMLASGMVDHQSLLAQCGLSGELIIQQRVRARMTSIHRELRRATAGVDLDSTECLLNEAHAAVDRYELHVLAGAHDPSQSGRSR